MKSVLLAAIALVLAPVRAPASGEAVYRDRCAACHHLERHGLSGPPLIPEYLGAKKEKELVAAVTDGLAATNMPGFRGLLSEGEILEVVRFIMTPAPAPEWGFGEMLSTRTTAAPAGPVSERTHARGDLFMVVEGGTGKVHFMDGASFTVLGSVKAGAVHGGPKFTGSLEHAYISSRDGWVIKYDLVNLVEAGRIRSGISARNLAVSSDEKRIAVATLVPAGLVIIDALTLEPVKRFKGIGAVSSVYALRGSRRFVAALKDRAELLFIDEATLEAKAVGTGQPITDFFIEPGERHIVGTSREGAEITVVDLREGKTVKALRSAARMPHLASAAFWEEGGSVFAAFPHIGEPVVSVLNLNSWELVAEIKVKGPGFFARTHDDVPHIWVDTGTDSVQLIDKKSLEVSGEVTPEPGKKAMHIEFTAEGSYALVSVWDDDGKVVVYDTRSLKPVKSLPFRRPVGKYNASNRRF